MASRLAFFAAATCALLLLAASASPPPPPAAVHRVVEAGWWTTVPSAGNGTDETLTQWAERQRFHVGDVLDFKAWNGSVILLARRGDYERCDTAASWGRQFEGGGGGGTDAGFVLYRPGIFYFASGVPGRCEAGLRMALRVAEARFAPTSGVAPAPDERAVPAAPGDAAPPAVVVKLTPSVRLWIATVGIFAVLFLFVILFCGIRQANLVKCFLDRPFPAPAGK